MLKVSVVTSEDELLQIHYLNQRNLKQNLDTETRRSEGFVTWLYSLELLKKMDRLAPAVVIKDGEKVVAYALTALQESKAFHPDLETMFNNLQSVRFKNKPLSDYRFYCMGQICIDKEYRGKGLVKDLYQKHRQVYSGNYDFILTEVSTTNTRSLKAHEKIGFQPIYTYRDGTDEWSVIVWDWQ